MIYWVLHKKLSISDWINPLEGSPGYFYREFPSLTFLDITDFGIYGQIDSFLVTDKNPKYDISVIPCDRYIMIKTKHDLARLLKNSNSPDIFIFQTYKEPRVTCLAAALNAAGRQTVLLNHWQSPSSTKPIQKKDRTWIAAKIKTNKKLLLMRIVYRVYMKCYKQKPHFDFILSGGNQFLKNAKRFCTFDTIIPVHSISYDEYLSVIENIPERIIPYHYFVFIDQGITIHPEFKTFTEQDTKKYQREMLSAFEHIEKKYNTKIVIGEHPRIKYPDGFYGNRECRQNATASLCYYADGIIGHFSGALNLARLFNKTPRIFLTSSESYFIFKKNVEQAYRYFGGTLYDMTNMNTNVCDGSSMNLKDSYTLLPENKERNKDLFTAFLRQFQ